MAAAGEALPSERGLARVQCTAGEIAATSEQEIHKAHAQLLATFKTGRTKSYDWRVAQLQGLRALLADHGDELCAAIVKDLGRPKMEAFLGDVASALGEVDYALENLKSWMRQETVSTPLQQKPGRSVVRREPKGVVLAIAPWNFPVQLALNSLTPIVAAGNCCLLKPSEITLNSEALLKTLLPKYLDPEAIIVVTGGVSETTALLKLRWDHIIYTGNGAVARVVARAAAEHLTPVTLELGGKSPTVVLPGADLQVSARRILSSKCFNAGQVCIAPDYALVHEAVVEPLTRELKTVLKRWYGDDASTSDSYGRIVNGRHFQRLKALLDSSGGEVLAQQGSLDESTNFVPPTLIKAPSPKSAVMEEEIFGPVLPMLSMASIEEMVEHINSGEKPLALYVFGPEAECNKIVDATSSGGVCVNDTILHAVNPHLPFGGVGSSGMGRYHGRWGFEEFSHVRGVMYRSTWLDPAQRYPPFNDDNLKVMKRLIVGPLLPPAAKKALVALGGAALAGSVWLMRSWL